MELKSFSVAELRARPGRKWHMYGEDVLPAWIAEMDFLVAEPIQRALEQLAERASYGYEEGTLSPALAEAFAGRMRGRFGWEVDTETVVPVSDLVQALFACVCAFTKPGDNVVLQMPIYPPFQHAVRETGRRIANHPLVNDASRYAMDTARQVPDAPMLLLCNPHNPTGRVFERHELEAIGRTVVERDMVVVSDEIHADMTYAGAKHVPFASLGPEVAARTVTITSATKAFNIPGLRCGLMHFGSPALRDRFRATVPDRMLGTVNQFGLKATIVAWQECDPWLDRVMALLQENRARLTQFLRSELPRVGYHEPEATYLAWLDFRRLELAQPQRFFLEHARVALNDGADFGTQGQGHARLNFATSPAILDEILRHLRDALLNRE
jgi:cysteine-S-conjugate beta-lyase